MANVLQYASVFQSELDKAAVELSTSGWMEPNSSLIPVHRRQDRQGAADRYGRPR